MVHLKYIILTINLFIRGYCVGEEKTKIVFDRCHSHFEYLHPIFFVLYIECYKECKKKQITELMNTNYRNLMIILKNDKNTPRK